MIHTKCILHAKSPKDGIRISVMSRHTLNDGITKDNRINGQFHAWMKSLAPSDKLVGDYYKRQLSWSDFKKRYIEHLRTPEIADKVKRLAKLALKLDFTIMCIEDSPDYCHRRLLAEEMQRYEPTLKVEHH